MKYAPVTLALTAVILVVSVAIWWFRDPVEAQALHARELATRMMAEHLAGARSGQRVLVVANPFIEQSDTSRDIVATERAGIRGVQEGFGARATVKTVYPELRPEAKKDPRSVFIDAETTTPMSFLVAEGAFDALLAAQPDADLVFSLIGLPAHLDLVKCWHDKGRPQFALLLPDLRMIGDARAVRQAVLDGKLAAFVLPKPDAPAATVPVGRDRKAEFEKRFLLVTSNNVDQVIQSYPKLFPGR